MKIQDLVKRYAMSPQVGAVADTLRKKSVKTIFLEGLLYSSAPMLFASLSLSLSKKKGNGSGSESSLLGDSGSLFLFVLQDAEEAGYFYHDLVQLLGDKQVLFFPSSYRRAVKYGQRDAPARYYARRCSLNSLLKLHSLREGLGVGSLSPIQMPLPNWSRHNGS